METNFSDIFEGEWISLYIFVACRDGLKKTNLVITMDSKSRLAGTSRKEISTKLNFGSFLEHYKSYNVAQDLYNKMVRLL